MKIIHIKFQHYITNRCWYDYEQISYNKPSSLALLPSPLWPGVLVTVIYVSHRSVWDNIEKLTTLIYWFLKDR